MKYILLLITSIMLSGCVKYVYVPRYQPIIINSEYTKNTPKPSKRNWTVSDMQGDHVGRYIIELNSSIDDSNIRFALIREYIEKYNAKVKELNDNTYKK